MWQLDVTAFAGVRVAGRGMAQPQLKHLWVGGRRQAADCVGYTATR